jgi:CHAT domain-containing protein
MDNKIIKEGKLILFSQKDYYLIFHLKNSNGDNKKYELPYPFNIDKENNYLMFDYKIESISKNDSELYYRLLSLNKNQVSRFYNNKVMMFEKNSLDLSVV